MQLNRLISVFSNAFKERRKKTLRYWIEGIWMAIGGPACLNNDTDFENVITFFNLLENLTNGNDISDISHLEKQLDNLTASPNQIDKPCIEIMTIHKAKGLEFDTVILAGLDRNVRADDKQLLLWMERAGEHGHDDLILAPIKATMHEYDAIYDYLRREEHKKSLYETQRLLYVAATRAKYQLHLVFHYEQNENNGIQSPSAQSLLAQLWPYLALDDITRIHDNNQSSADVKNEAIEHRKIISNPPLKRLKKFKVI
jgi:ATP-dependent exoDNAse (exonuclease V) beta subunit